MMVSGIDREGKMYEVQERKKVLEENEKKKIKELQARNK